MLDRYNFKKNRHNTPIALILGGYINGYNIIRELHTAGVQNIVLFDTPGHSVARHSNKISKTVIFKFTAAALESEIKKLHEAQHPIIIFPTDDLQLELLHEIQDTISAYAFLPFNADHLSKDLMKDTQYDVCERIGIPYPLSISIENITEIERIHKLTLPILIKPAKRDDLKFGGFRNLYIDKYEDIQRCTPKLIPYLENGVSLVVSEFIPGDDTQIFAYTAYRTKKGQIANDWIGKKLTQHPDAFGVFSSACNIAPETIREQGRALIEAMNLHGIVEPEFKYDVRDGKYKLMEINLRSMMWHRTGNLCGVQLQFSQWCDAIGEDIPQYDQNTAPLVHFVYMKHEISNLVGRWGYWKHFWHNVFGIRNVHFAVFDKSDMKPFFADLIILPKVILGRWLKPFLNR